MNGPQITFFGRLTRDPVLRYGRNNGTRYLNVGVAVNTYRGREQEPTTTFFDITLWGNQAENCASNCRKGDEVFIQGTYSLREYTRQDGRAGFSHQVDTRDFRRFSQASNMGMEPAQQEPAGEFGNRETENQPRENDGDGPGREAGADGAEVDLSEMNEPAYAGPQDAPPF